MTTLKGETYKERLLINFLRSPESIRSSCIELYNVAVKGQLIYFDYHPEKMQVAADYVIKIMLANYPTLEIPDHSRNRHFEAGVNRIKLLSEKVSGLAGVKSLIELIIVSVFLDAGAGTHWRYMDHLSNATLNRSEGLAAATFNLFMQGLFSADNQNLYQADALGLQQLTENVLAAGFQVADHNELLGLAARVELLHNLGKCLQTKTEFFGGDAQYPRLANILDYWAKSVSNDSISVRILFHSLLDAFSEIWPHCYIMSGVNLGDVWPYSLNCKPFNPQGFIPFHKITQWLCYSLVEPLAACGIKVTDMEVLTGLPEYRNGGLFIDMGVLVPKDSNAFNVIHELSSELIVEWRGMTVALLDQVAVLIRDKLKLTATQLPMSKILQGGTWLAGREIAHQLRIDGSPPLKLASDGTLF